VERVPSKAYPDEGPSFAHERENGKGRRHGCLPRAASRRAFRYTRQTRARGSSRPLRPKLRPDPPRAANRAWGAGRALRGRRRVALRGAGLLPDDHAAVSAGPSGARLRQRGGRDRRRGGTAAAAAAGASVGRRRVDRAPAGGLSGQRAHGAPGGRLAGMDGPVDAGRARAPAASVCAHRRGVVGGAKARACGSAEVAERAAPEHTNPGPPHCGGPSARESGTSLRCSPGLTTLTSGSASAAKNVPSAPSRNSC